jgi:hypothetical protein
MSAFDPKRTLASQAWLADRLQSTLTASGNNIGYRRFTKTQCIRHRVRKEFPDEHWGLFRAEPLAE